MENIEKYTDGSDYQCDLIIRSRGFSCQRPYYFDGDHLLVLYRLLSKWIPARSVRRCSSTGKRGGRPCVRGMRITVYDVLSYLAAGMTIDEVLSDFPYLTPEDIQACFAFAAERERSMQLAVA